MHVYLYVKVHLVIYIIVNNLNYCVCREPDNNLAKGSKVHVYRDTLESKA